MMNQPDPDQPLRSEELLKRAKQDQKAALDASHQLLQEHLDLLLMIENNFRITPSDLIGNKIQQIQQLPQEIRKQIASLQEMVRTVILETAQHIENRNYRDAEASFDAKLPSQVRREQATQLIAADKQLSISTRSLSLAVDHFIELNRSILTQLKRSEAEQDATTARRLVLANAVLVYELSDFVIRFIEGFQVFGVEQLKVLRQESEAAIARFRRRQETLLKEANQPGVTESGRKETEQEIKDQENALQKIEKEWESYWGQVEDAKKLPQSYAAKLPDLRLMRSRAEVRLDFITIVELHSLIERNLHALDMIATAITTQLEMPRLTTERIQLLLGGIDRGSATN